jgi:hypothetical protein
MNIECIEWLAPFKDVVLIITGITGSVVAVKGLSTWRRQLYGQSEYDIARRILKSVYLFREHLINARHPFMSYSPEPNLPKEKLEEMSDKEKKWHSEGQAWEERWKPVAKSRAELDTNLLESEIYWEKTIWDAVRPMVELQAELIVAIEEHLERINPSDPDPSYTGDEWKRVSKVIYSRSDRNKDEFLDKLLVAVEKVEKLLKPHIKKKK